MRCHYAYFFALLLAGCKTPNFGITTDTADACADEACLDAGDADAAPIPTPTCSDALKNGDETDVDCGGSCAPCSVNQHCASGADCSTQVCTDVCQPANCSDGVRNGSESAVDCGGSCAGCAVGASCNTGSDCASGSCGKGTCLSAKCSDSVQNGDETDVDCGGSCGPCTTKQGCIKAADCDSLSCVSKHCAAPSCSDGIQNGSETDLDCGGSCAPCMSGQTCAAVADCSTAICKSGYCLPKTATGGMLLRTGWTATASASTTNSTPADALDASLTTRWSSGTAQVVGMYYELDMQKPQIFFSFALDSADSPGDAPALFDVYLSLDGTFTTPALTAQSGMPTTIVTFPNAQIARYIKIVLTNDKSSNWWGIREFTVSY
jgi:hypothetical protein